MVQIIEVDLTTILAAELAEIAHAHGVAFNLVPNDPATLIVHPHRDPAMASLVTALRARREEVAAFLVRHRPQFPAITDEEAMYRRVVLGEPDVPISELSWPVLKALIARTVLEVLDSEQSAAEWEASIATRDAVPPGPRKRKRTARRSQPGTDLVVF